MQKLWERAYVCNAGINFLIYVVYFMMMLWTVSYTLAEWDTSISVAGLASGLFMAGALSTRGPVNRFLDKMDRRTMLLVSTGLFFLLSLPYLAIGNLYLFMAARFIHGVAFGAATTAVSTAAASLTPMKQVNRITKYYTLGVAAASAAGPFLALRIIDEGMLDTGALAASAMTLVALLLAFFVQLPRRTIIRRALDDEKKPVKVDNFFVRRALYIAILAFLGGVCYSVVITFLGEYAMASGLPAAGGVYFFYCFAFATFLCRPLAGYLLERCGRDMAVYPALLLIVVSMIALSLSSANWMLLIAGFLFGAGYRTLITTCHNLTLRCSFASHAGSLRSIYFVLLDLGIGFGPFLLGGLVPDYGFSMVYLVAAAIAFFGIYLYYIELGKTGHFSAERWEEGRLAKGQ